VGFDFKAISGDDFFQSSIGGILGKVALSTGAVTTNGAETMSFGIVNGSDAFFGFLEALRREQIAKIMAEPNLTAYSGRPASFNSGGEFPIIVPQSLGTVSVQYKKFGTEIEFVPIVLGNGAIRLEVKPRVSEIDDTRSVVVQGINVPGLRVREANTGVEMRAGQTLALAGLVFNRTQTDKREIPWAGELPWVGALFRRNRETIDETELLILVTPQFVEAVDACNVPPGGPGLSTSSPNDVQFYLKGHIEVPRCPEDDRCAPSRSPGTAADDAARYHGYDASYEGEGLPGGVESIVPLPEARKNGKLLDGGAGPRVLQNGSPAGPQPAKAVREQVTLAKPASPAVRVVPKTPTKSASYNRSARNNSNTALAPRNSAGPSATGSSPGFIGPIGYDVKE
jgi:pilus assembly protein CpaC